MKLKMIKTKAERGFATVASLECGIEVALWHATLKGLGEAFEKITGRIFYDSYAQPTAIYYDREARKTH